MKKIITKFGIISAMAIPALVFAQATASTKTKTLDDLVLLVVKYFNVAISLIIGLAVVLFVWNVYKYFIAGGDNVESKKEAGKYVLWSIIGFFVILSVWGIVNILIRTFNFDSNIPQGFFGTFQSSSYSQSSSPSRGSLINRPSSSINNSPFNGSPNNTVISPGANNTVVNP